MEKFTLNIPGEGKTLSYWEMPELSEEISELFSQVGNVKVLSQTQNGKNIHFEIWLKQPAKVVDLLSDFEKCDGIAINAYTHRCIGSNPAIYVYPLPKNHDEKVTLSLYLELVTPKESELCLDDIRNIIRGFADEMNKTWGYRFR